MALTDTDYLKQRILNVKRKLPPGRWAEKFREMFPDKYETGTPGGIRLKNVLASRATHIEIIKDLETLADSLKAERSETRKAKRPAKSDKPRKAVVKLGQDKILTRAQAARGG